MRMDEVVKVRRSFLNRIRGFLNIFAEMCRGCMRKAERGCVDCGNLRAKALVAELDNLKNASEELYWIDNPVRERQELILRAIRQAGRPLTSKEIRVDGISKSLKCFTLKRMCKKHILGSRKDGGGRYEFFILNDVLKSRSSTTERSRRHYW